MSKRAEQLLLGFSQSLRNAGLNTHPLRISDFLHAAQVLPLRCIGDLHRAGRLTLVSKPEDFPIYDTVFDGWFCQDHLNIFALEEDDESKLSESPPESSEFDQQSMPMSDAKGELASADEVLGRREIAPPTMDELYQLSKFGNEASDILPVMKSRRRVPTLRGKRIDLRRTIQEARRNHGEPFVLHYSKSPKIMRPILVLIDVSGSMKDYTEAILRFSHTLVHTGNRVEVFCFGTRLTRITKKLRHKNVGTALADLSDLVLDFDGGTRIGPSILRLLQNSRFMSSIRGAVTLVMSDGLERGDIAAMQNAVTRLARLSHQLVWLTPLAADPAYRPETRGMKSILPQLDSIENGSTLSALIAAMRNLRPLEAKPRGRAARKHQTSEELS